MNKFLLNKNSNLLKKENLKEFKPIMNKFKKTFKSF